MPAFQHVALNCRDLERSRAFYEKHFGFKLARIFKEGEPDMFYMLRLGEARLELFTADAPGRAGEQPVGFKHMAFEVPDLEAAIAALEADGIEPDPIIDCAHVVEGMRICFFDDPDGNRLELMQGYADQFPE